MITHMRSAALIVAVALLPGCVILVHDDTPRVPPGDAVLESARVEGFEARVLTQDQRETATYTDLGASASSNSDWGGHVRGTSEERSLETWKPSSRYRDVAVHAAEDSRVFVYVNAGPGPDVILRGAVGEDSSSYGQWWTIPTNTVLSIGLGLFPWTWGQTSEARVRAYAGDGRFLREYRASVDVRSWHQPYEKWRHEAEKERLVRGREQAVARVIADVVRDLRTGALDASLVGGR
jgi:hypothetical protein